MLLQAASLLGLGLLYQGSCHHLMTEILLEDLESILSLPLSASSFVAPAVNTLGPIA
jgi:hypothetical protein